MKRFIAFFLVFCMILPVVPAQAASMGGPCGENVSYKYNLSSYSLTISGTGPMEDYQAVSNGDYWSGGKSPGWNYYVKQAEIQEGVTHIGNYAFYDRSMLTLVMIPKSVTSIGNGAFLNCHNLSVVQYAGSKADWEKITIGTGNQKLTSAEIRFTEEAPEETTEPEEEKEYQLSVYATDRSLSVSRGDYLKLLCTLRSGEETVTDWASPACVVGTKNVIQVGGWEKTENGAYWLTVTGLKAGTSSVTVTDSVSGANVTLDITVNDTDAIPYTDLITNVPHFYPQVFGDRDTLTNFYNISGMYMRDFPYASEIKPVNGYYNLSFTLYSTSSMYGSVDVYDKDGNWRSATRINKFPPTPTSIFEIGADTFLLVADAFQGATLSYTANSFSAETKVSIKVPVGGYFTISNNALESPSCMLYNSLDLMLETLSLGADVTFTAKDLIDIQDEIVAQALLKPAFLDAFLSQTNDFIKDSYQSATLKNTADFISEFTNISVEILADQGIDVWAILKAALNISTDVAVKVLTPKFISATLGLLLTGNKAVNMLCQAVEIKYCEDNDYVVLHTADSGKTICGVQVKDENSVLPEGALMQVFRVGEYADFAYELEGQPMQAENFTLYNICFTKGGKEVNPSGQVEVMIPKPEGYRDCVILHQQEDGSWTPVNYWTAEGIVHFYVNHFSLFAVVDKGGIGGDAVARVFGADRYATAFKAADTLKAALGVSQFQNIIVACGTNFPDALAGTYLAAQKSAPILLVKGNNVAELNEYIRNNLASGGTLYLLGDNGVVPDSVGKGISGITIKRLGGATRYDTNLLILQEAGVGNKDIIVCTGLNFADSLSASATGLPILLVKDGLYDSQKEFLKNNGGNFIIVGGTNAVNTTVEKQLASYGSVKRLAGSTRYDTSVLVAKEFFQSPTSAVLAYAKNFPDGLSGGPLAYTLNAPLILTDNSKPTAAVTYATGAGIRSGYVLGGTGLISDKVVKNIFSMAENQNINVN